MHINHTRCIYNVKRAIKPTAKDGEWKPFGKNNNKCNQEKNNIYSYIPTKCTFNCPHRGL